MILWKSFMCLSLLPSYRMPQKFYMLLQFCLAPLSIGAMFKSFWYLEISYVSIILLKNYITYCAATSSDKSDFRLLHCRTKYSYSLLWRYFYFLSFEIFCIWTNNNNPQFLSPREIYYPRENDHSCFDHVIGFLFGLTTYLLQNKYESKVNKLF